MAGSLTHRVATRTWPEPAPNWICFEPATRTQRPARLPFSGETYVWNTDGNRFGLGSAIDVASPDDTQEYEVITRFSREPTATVVVGVPLAEISPISQVVNPARRRAFSSSGVAVPAALTPVLGDRASGLAVPLDDQRHGVDGSAQCSLHEVGVLPTHGDTSRPSSSSPKRSPMTLR